MNKIMFISPKDNNFYNFRKELIIKLKNLGNEIILVCPYGNKMEYFIKKGCRFIDVDVDRRGKNIFNDIKLIKKYKEIFLIEKPDIILTYTSKPSIYGGYLSSKMGIPYIVNNAGLMECRGFFDIFMKFLYWISWKKANCIMYQNTMERDTINKLLRFKVHYRDIPGSGVNIYEFKLKKYPLDDDIIVFNFVARIVDIKGIGEFLECAKIIKKKYKNTRFMIYGDYDDYSYKEKIDMFQNNNIVEYCGLKKDMRPFIEKAHAVIHPSYYEGMTNVILEHSSMGRVAISSNIAGCKEAIEDGVTGFLFDVKNVDSMVRAVERFIKLSYEKKKEMGINARKKIEKEFKRDIVTDIYIEEINKILQNN